MGISLVASHRVPVVVVHTLVDEDCLGYTPYVKLFFNNYNPFTNLIIYQWNLHYREKLTN